MWVDGIGNPTNSILMLFKSNILSFLLEILEILHVVIRKLKHEVKKYTTSIKISII